MGGNGFKAVIPAAGRGMRMRPLSRIIPKEMFPLGNKPIIQYAVEEAIAAGIGEICIVIRKGKETIRDYFLGRTREKPHGIARVLKNSCKLTFTYQKSWDGLGGALRAARRFVSSDPFLMLIPDQLLHPHQTSASQQLLSHYPLDRPMVLSSMVKIPKKEVRYFHGARGFLIDGGNLRYHGLLPISGVQSDSRTRLEFIRKAYEIRGFGRTVFPPTIFSYLDARFTNPSTGEIDLLKTFKEFPKKIPHYGILLRGRPCDLGTLPGYYRYLPPMAKDF